MPDHHVNTASSGFFIFKIDHPLGERTPSKNLEVLPCMIQSNG